MPLPTQLVPTDKVTTAIRRLLLPRVLKKSRYDDFGRSASCCNAAQTSWNSHSTSSSSSFPLAWYLTKISLACSFLFHLIRNCWCFQSAGCTGFVFDVSGRFCNTYSWRLWSGCGDKDHQSRAEDLEKTRHAPAGLAIDVQPGEAEPRGSERSSIVEPIVHSSEDRSKSWMGNLMKQRWRSDFCNGAARTKDHTACRKIS
jgi:hypothetical protein